MRYDDASQTASMAADHAPSARPDVDTLPPGSFGPATGNAITGTGTVSGVAGADMVSEGPGRIVAVEGAGGPTNGTAGNFQAAGQYGILALSEQGDFNYVRNPGTPDGVQDVFRYTLADAQGATSSTTLTIRVGEIAAAAALDGVLNLPAGVELSDIRVNGRDLVITMPDGSQMVIPGGAVFVPQLVIGDVQVPPSNLAALLIDAEPRPAAGQLPSSGGPPPPPVPPLDPGIPLGDLIPPTELDYTPPDFEEVGGFIDREPTIVIIPDGQPAAVNAVDSVDESGLAARPGEPAGTLEAQDIETTTGVIAFVADDGLDSIFLSVEGVPGQTEITANSAGTIIVGLRGDLTITSVNLTTGQIGYSYTVRDNTTDGVDDFEDFTIVLTDSDGDTVTGTLHINIEDDDPSARSDTDALVGKETSTDGNVLTAVGTTSSPGSADTPGADGYGSPAVATDGVNGIHAGTSGAFTDVGGSPVSVTGSFGTLTIESDGSYVYTRAEGGRGGGTDVFTYRIIDGDGDTATATLTITVPADPIPQPAAATAIVDDDGLVPGDQDDGAGDDVVPNNDADGLQSTYRGTLTANFGGDGPNATNAFDLHAMDGVSQVIGQETVTYHWNDATDILTAEITASVLGGRVESDLFQVHVNPITGQYDV
ncbi:MAG TPA: hypothetical protein VM165_20165, partial [Planctomycetaceae bacterium]|nr:hypothetical protein [Planctomycetaceae bacterium]